MPEQHVSFSVADFRAARRAGTWKCFAPTHKREIYLACRELDGGLKVSLHASGSLNVAFAKRREDLFAPEHAPATRFIVQSQLPSAVSGVRVACRIVTPHTSVSVPMSAMDRGITYRLSPGRELAIETLIVVAEPNAVKLGGWPGKNKGVSAVGCLRFPDGSEGWVVSRSIVHSLAPHAINGTARFFKGASKENLSERNLRMLSFGSHSDGSIVITEAAVVQRGTVKVVA